MREIKLYNTLGREKQNFSAPSDRPVKMYTCGPTVYDSIHIGNIRAYVTADILRRTLTYFGYQIDHVTNITDVDDKTIRRSREMGKTLSDLTDIYIESYLGDIAAVNILQPTHSPRATDPENLVAMIQMIEALIQKGFAYTADDGVYFSIEKASNYGELSGGVSTGKSRIQNDEYDKENASDFALWKFQTPEDGEVGWEAPFGKGRPGWHIECSAMIHRILGEPIDIHTGGVDLIFPHHTNEIAQTHSVSGDDLAKFWVHNEHLSIENTKMSKSLGNSYTLRDITSHGFEPLAFRYFLLTAHYRQKQNFTWDALEAAQTALYRLVSLLVDKEEASTGEGKIIENYHQEFESTVSDDLNMPSALAVVWEVARSGEKPQDILSTILNFDSILGLGLKRLIQKERRNRTDIPDAVRTLAKEREIAREAKDFKKADELRDQIVRLGYEVSDSSDGPKIRKQ